MNPRTLGVLLGVLFLVEGLAFTVAALVHAGAPVLALREPPAPQNAFAEAFIAVAMLVAAAAAFARRAWARKAAFVAHALVVVGVMMAMANLAVAPMARSIANDIFYRFVLVCALLMLVFLLTPTAVAALERRRNA